MKKKTLIILILAVLLTSVLAILFLSQKDQPVDEVVARTTFKATSNISCVSVDREDYDMEELPENSIEAYVKGEQDLDGIEYDGSDPEGFVYELIENGKIVTFMHMYADVCLIDNEESNDAYLLDYKVRHVYYTNSKNVETYNFTVEIDKGTKGIKIVTTN
jgi:hypothetical protein